jgi:DNA-binding NarL/FixJ family response regulator
MVGMLTRSAVPVHPSARLQWQRLAAHISAGFRIRRKIAESGAVDATHGAEAILESSGAVAHASDAATPRSSRDALRAAVLAADRARGPLRRRAPDEAIEAWRGLVAGRWTLLDHFDRDGRRYLLAHRNDPDAPDPRALTLRERQVVGYVALGQSNKLIAYELGLSASTVGVLLKKAAAKLGARSRTELGMFGSPGRSPGDSADG